MEEQKTTDVPVAIEDQKPPTDPEWMTFRTTKDGFRSKAKIKTSFFNEHKNNLKTVHYNKRRFRRGTDSLENIPNSHAANSKFPINDKSTNQVYQTAVPNSVCLFPVSFAYIIGFLYIPRPWKQDLQHKVHFRRQKNCGCHTGKFEAKSFRLIIFLERHFCLRFQRRRQD